MLRSPNLSVSNTEFNTTLKLLLTEVPTTTHQITAS